MRNAHAFVLFVLFVFLRNGAFVFAIDRYATTGSLAAEMIAPTGAARNDPAAGGYSTGFEQPQFFPASLLNQQGWTVSDNAIVSSFVATFNPDTGAQHMRMIDNPGVASSETS